MVRWNSDGMELGGVDSRRSKRGQGRRSRSRRRWPAMVKALRRKWAEAAEHFGVATQFMVNGAKWASRNNGDRLQVTCEEFWRCASAWLRQSPKGEPMEGQPWPRRS